MAKEREKEREREREREGVANVRCDDGRCRCVRRSRRSLVNCSNPENIMGNLGNLGTGHVEPGASPVVGAAERGTLIDRCIGIGPTADPLRLTRLVYRAGRGKVYAGAGAGAGTSHACMSLGPHAARHLIPNLFMNRRETYETVELLSKEPPDRAENSRSARTQAAWGGH